MGRSKTTRRRRESSHFTNHRLPTRSIGPVRYDDPFTENRYVTEVHQAQPTRRRANLRLVEDRRRFHPEGPRRRAAAFNRWAPRIITPGWAALGGAAVTAKLAFAEPSSVAICVRRKQRREVLLARGHGGKKGQRRPKRNWYSNIRCRR